MTHASEFVVLAQFRRLWRKKIQGQRISQKKATIEITQRIVCKVTKLMMRNLVYYIQKKSVYSN